MGGILNIIIGIVCIAGGLSGHLRLIGTNSGYLLAGIGAVLVAWGSYRVYRNRQMSSGKGRRDEP
jgi:hypothetical protein